MGEMTYSSIFVINGREVSFLELAEKDKGKAANQTARLSLEGLGNAHIVKQERDIE